MSFKGRKYHKKVAKQPSYEIIPLTKTPTEIKLGDDYTVASIDPGLEHFAIRIERRQLITQNNSMQLKITPLYFNVHNLKEKDSQKFRPVLYELVCNLQNLLSSCNLIIIEKQIQRGPIHTSVHVVLHTFYAYLTVMFVNLQKPPVVIEVSPNIKNNYCATKNFKIEAIEWAKYWIQERQDNASWNVIETLQNGYKYQQESISDLADTIFQMETCLHHLGIASEFHKSQYTQILENLKKLNKF